LKYGRPICSVKRLLQGVASDWKSLWNP